VQEGLATAGFTASPFVAAAGRESWASVRDQARIGSGAPRIHPDTSFRSNKVRVRDTPTEPGGRSQR
jgi:hypothetical protein